MNVQKTCVLCNEDLAKNARDSRWLKGNNAEPLAKGQCCDPCNDKVIAVRLANTLRHRGQPEW